jgi:hypothetical protein
MIHLELVRLVNSGTAWAFIGSGVSCDAGLPGWIELLERVRTVIATGKALPTESARQLQRLVAQGNLPGAFEILSRDYGREALVGAIEAEIRKISIPGRMHELLSHWPFSAYVTTNFDLLIDKALKNKPNGWTTIGNTASETAKVSKGVKNIVWHPHGIVPLSSSTRHLVVCQSDYDEIYPSGSPTYQTLEAVLRMVQTVFVGFGFSDPDLMTLLRKVSRVSTPGRPAYAFLHGTTQDQRYQLKLEYNVEVIPYEVHGSDHSELLKILSAYASFVVARDIQFGKASIGDIGYDPGVTSLLVQNKIHSGAIEGSLEANEAVMRASVLSSLGERSLTVEEARALGATINGKNREAAINAALKTLIERGLIQDNGETLELTTAGSKAVVEGSAAAQLSRDQFAASLETRVLKIDGTVHARAVATVAADFFEHIARDRGLGLAQNLASVDALTVRHRAVALIQDLPKWFAKCASRQQTLVLVQVIADVLRMPNNHEREYLGLLTQAYFGRHLCGIDLESIDLRRQLLGETVFVCDSHFLIPLLAKGSVGHAYASELLDLIKKSSSKLVATELLLVEAMEHADFAVKLVKQHGENSARVLDATRGAHGFRSNAFLEGFFSDRASNSGLRFLSYLGEVFKGRVDEGFTLPLVKSAAERLGIYAGRLNDWHGFDARFFTSRQELEEEITRRRYNHGTFKHERQVAAEAEVAMMISAIRLKEISAPGHNSTNGFFLSHSRVIDNLQGLPSRLTISPESLYQWLLTVRAISPEQARALFDQLLYDMAETGHQIFPRDKILQSFSGVIEASRDSIARVVTEHREVVLQIYGEDPSKAFSEIDPLELPDAAEQIKLDVLRQTEQLRVEESIKRRRAEKIAQEAADELASLLRLKAKQQQKRRKSKKKQRAAKSKKRR